MIITFESFLTLNNLVKKKKSGGVFVFFPMRFPALLNLATLYMYVINKSEYKRD